MQHKKLAKLLSIRGFYTLIINGKGLKIVASYSTNEVEPEISDAEFKEFVKSNPPETIDPEDGETLADTIRRIYHSKPEYKANRFAITGNLCVERGVTLMSVDKYDPARSFFFTHAILSDVPNRSTAYQMAGRLCGGFKTQMSGPKIIVISTTKHWEIVTEEEATAIKLSNLYENLERNKKETHPTVCVKKSDIFPNGEGLYI